MKTYIKPQIDCASSGYSSPNGIFLVGGKIIKPLSVSGFSGSQIQRDK